MTQPVEETTQDGLKALSQLGQQLLDENKRNRRFKIFNRLFWLALVLAILVLPQFFKGKFEGGPLGEHAAIVQMQGLVMSGAEIDAQLINPVLGDAFSAKQSIGVVLDINSPGGSPVQAELIYDEIIRLKAEFPDKKVIAVIGDVGASAAYYIAAAADEIVSAKASLVGSIGVVINGFGAVDAMEKLGIERRLITAGSNKAMLDPFSPEDAGQRAYIQSVVDEVHEQFIDVVKTGRGDRLGDDEALFSGLIWNGSKAIELGLVDHLGSVDTAAYDLLGAESKFNYSPVPTLWEEISGELGVQMAAAFKRVFSSQGGLSY